MSYHSPGTTGFGYKAYWGNMNMAFEDVKKGPLLFLL